MAPAKKTEISPHDRTGKVIAWFWSDKEVENPALLKNQLEDIRAAGFQGVLACLGRTRYELTDRKVVRAATQASQWAKRRGIFFWLQADPRRASRSMISATGERTRYLSCARETGAAGEHGRWRPNIVRVRKNRFFIRIPFPAETRTPVLHEMSLRLEPAGLERAFLFKIENGAAAAASLRDITSETRFFCNASDHTVEAFGEVRTPPKEPWYAMAFFNFESNLIDYAGRANVDSLLDYVENLFEAGLYLDGICWDHPGFFRNAGNLPVSLSLFNAFIAEYGYDLRDRLPALFLDFDNASHIPVRCDYASLLDDSVTQALGDFRGMLHAYFGDIEMLVPSDLTVSGPAAGSLDSWQGLSVSFSASGALRHKTRDGNRTEDILSTMAEIKSLGVFSRNQKAYVLLKGFGQDRDESAWCADLAALFSIQRLMREYGTGGCGRMKARTEPGFPNRPEWSLMPEWNRHHDSLAGITGYKFPESDTLLVLPHETLISANAAGAEALRAEIRTLAARLILGGAQLDVVSSGILKKAKLEGGRLHFRNRIYRSVIFPHPMVLNLSVLDLLSSAEMTGFPVLLGGSRPQWTCDGRAVPQDFPIAFDVSDPAFAEHFQAGAERDFEPPENALGSVIQTGTETLLLFCPKQPGGSFEGKARFQNTAFPVSKSGRIAIYMMKEDKIKKVL
jgi:hypothetical protein